jgi:hypothetical protein
MNHVRAAAFAVFLGLAAAPAVADDQAITLFLNDASVVRPHSVTVQARTVKNPKRNFMAGVTRQPSSYQTAS